MHFEHQSPEEEKKNPQLLVPDAWGLLWFGPSFPGCIVLEVGQELLSLTHFLFISLPLGQFKVVSWVSKFYPKLGLCRMALIDTMGIVSFFFLFFFFFFFWLTSLLFLFQIHFFLFFKLLFSYSCLHFLPIPPPQPSQTHLPPPAPTVPLDFAHVSFIEVTVIPSPHCPLPTPTWRLLDCS